MVADGMTGWVTVTSTVESGMMSTTLPPGLRTSWTSLRQKHQLFKNLQQYLNINLVLALVELQGSVQFDSIRPVKMSAMVLMLVRLSYRVTSSEQSGLGQLQASHMGRGKFIWLSVWVIKASSKRIGNGNSYCLWKYFLVTFFIALENLCRIVTAIFIRVIFSINLRFKCDRISPFALIPKKNHVSNIV